MSNSSYIKFQIRTSLVFIQIFFNLITFMLYRILLRFQAAQIEIVRQPLLHFIIQNYLFVNVYSTCSGRRGGMRGSLNNVVSGFLKFKYVILEDLLMHIVCYSALWYNWLGLVILGAGVSACFKFWFFIIMNGLTYKKIIMKLR